MDVFRTNSALYMVSDPSDWRDQVGNKLGTRIRVLRFELPELTKPAWDKQFDSFVIHDGRLCLVNAGYVVWTSTPVINRW